MGTTFFAALRYDAIGLEHAISISGTTSPLLDTGIDVYTANCTTSSCVLVYMTTSSLLPRLRPSFHPTLTSAHSLSDPWYSLPAMTVLLAPACCCAFLLGFLGLRAVRMLELLLLRAPLGWPADSACGGPAPPAADALTPL